MRPVVLFCPLLLLACQRPEPAPAAPRPVVVRQVQAGESKLLAAYAGEVRARHEADLAFRIGGKITERRVNLGDAVRKGAVLARIDAGDAQLALAASAAQVSAAEADLALAATEYERARSLAGRSFVSGSVVDSRRTQWQAAQARLNQARAQAGVAGNQLGYTTLLADRDGIVTALPGEAGQVVAAGQTVARIADPREREVLIHVPETRVAALAVGQPALVRPWSRQDLTLTGTVREIAGSADATTRTFAVRIAVADAAGRLPLGSTAAVAFAARSETGVQLPLSAVSSRDGRSQVWVVGTDDKAEPRAVELDGYRDDGVRIRSGLAAGDRVVVVGAHTLTPGQIVRPLAERAPAALDVRR